MSANSQEEFRDLKISVLKFDPHNPESKPKMETFDIKETLGMTLFIALNKIRETYDSSLQYDFVCRAGICGSCGMLIDGRPGLACRTLTKSLGTEITLAPLPGFELIGDLSVNTGKWMHGMSEQLETWIHKAEGEQQRDTKLLEEVVDPDVIDEVFELDRCIECGCCVAGCGTYQMNNDFVGAVGMNKVMRYSVDPKDKRSDEDMFELVGSEDGVFGCMSLMGCDDVCPKELPLQSKIAYLRRKMVALR
jgi:fumarate reductase iron-sulfur subunit